MAYTPTTWVTGDTITATKLNHIESGVQEVSSGYTPNTWTTGDIITATKLNNIEQGIANAGGNPYDYAGITFATVTITGNTPPEDSDPVTSIVASSMVMIGNYSADFSNVPQQLTQLVVPVSSTEPTYVSLYANDSAYLADTSATTGTGGVTIDGDIYVSGDGTINIVWTWS